MTVTIWYDTFRAEWVVERIWNEGKVERRHRQRFTVR